MSGPGDLAPSTLDRIRHDLVGLKMPRALEALDQVVRRLEQGEIGALEAIDILLAEELTRARTAASRPHCAWAAWRPSRRSPGSTSPSSPHSTASASSRSPSSALSGVARSCTSSARPAPARATWRPPSASRP